MTSVLASPSATAPASLRSDSHLARFRRSMLRDRAALLGAALLVVIAATVLLAPFVSPFDPLETNPANRLSPPLRGPHVLGTDELGRDIFSRLAYGGRISLLVALLRSAARWA
jgi:peptide/nickel transport system permease protein